MLLFRKLSYYRSSCSLLNRNDW